MCPFPTSGLVLFYILHDSVLKIHICLHSWVFTCDSQPHVFDSYAPYMFISYFKITNSSLGNSGGLVRQFSCLNLVHLTCLSSVWFWSKNANIHVSLLMSSLIMLFTAKRLIQFMIQLNFLPATASSLKALSYCSVFSYFYLLPFLTAGHLT